MKFIIFLSSFQTDQMDEQSNCKKKSLFLEYATSALTHVIIFYLFFKGGSHGGGIYACTVYKTQIL